MSTDLPSWASLWRELGARGDPAPWHRQLMAAYGEPHRAYHNLKHLDECLTELAANRKIATQPALIEVALWFHDAVYNARSFTNEEDSAKLAADCLASAGVNVGNVAIVKSLIFDTKTHQPTAGPDAELLIDIDLAILGQPPGRFWEYEHAIRAEYAWVPAATFAQKRSEILAQFLQRAEIYRTESFRRKYEFAARTNLQTAIERLQTSQS
jgi:predicted metal-dependent HD superfamily phosphohydrolase